ncbi:ABC transporter ATP-binding protein, partial [candidate division KSB1 bacterium]
LNGNSIKNSTPAVLKKLNIGCIPSERELDGIISDFSVAENIILGRHRSDELRSRLFLCKSKITEKAQKVIDNFNIMPNDPEISVSLLSGGNQQKVVLGREQHEAPVVLIACNPSRGVDIITINFLYTSLQKLSGDGTGILLILSDTDEALSICDRIHVLYNGGITGDFLPEKTDAVELGYYMTGGRDD